jgi:hypothetical protein
VPIKQSPSNQLKKLLTSSGLKIGSSGRIQRFFLLCLMRFKRSLLGNQANSGTTCANFFIAVCWQFCWQPKAIQVSLLADVCIQQI